MNRLAMALLAAIILIWGANWPILKVGLAHIPPLWLALLRLVLGAALLAAMLAVSREGFRRPGRTDLPVVLSVGLLQMAGFTALMNIGLLHVDAGRSAILAYTTPLWVAPGAVLLLGEPLGRLGVAGVVLGMLGVAVLFDPAGFDWSDAAVVRGNAMLLGAAFLWAGAILHVRGHRWRASALALAPWQMIAGAVALLPVTIAVEGPPRIAWNATSVFVIVYNALLATAFGFWAVMTVTRTLPAVTASLAFLGVPIAGLLFSAWWLDERLGSDKILALALVLAGVAAVTLQGRDKPGPPA
jgi:drug/metabolite transporter (DMT)-like permease